MLTHVFVCLTNHTINAGQRGVRQGIRPDEEPVRRRVTGPRALPAATLSTAAAQERSRVRLALRRAARARARACVCLCVSVFAAARPAVIVIVTATTTTHNRHSGGVLIPQVAGWLVGWLVRSLLLFLFPFLSHHTVALGRSRSAAHSLAHEGTPCPPNTRSS